MCQCDDLDMMAVAAAGATPGQKGAIIQRTHLLALLIRCRLKAPVVATPRHRGFSRRRRAPAALGTPHGWFWVLLLAAAPPRGLARRDARVRDRDLTRFFGEVTVRHAWLFQVPEDDGNWSSPKASSAFHLPTARNPVGKRYSYRSWRATRICLVHKNLSKNFHHSHHRSPLVTTSWSQSH